MFVLAGLAVSFSFGVFELMLGAVFNDLGSVVAGFAVGGYAVIVLGIALLMIGRRTPIERVVQWALLPIFVPITVVGIIQPGVALLVTILPVAAAMTYLDGRQMRRITVLSVITAVVLTISADVLPARSSVPVEVLLPIHLSGAVSVILLIAMLIWQFRSRLRATTRELVHLIDMSRDLGQTLELSEVGDLTARYVAEAVGADECGIVSWDRESDRILLYGYYPAERRPAVARSYDLRDYPLTREVLAGATVLLSDDDPDAEPNEVRYLHGIGQRSMASMPLVARGRVLGAIEATSGRPSFFDVRRVSRIAPLAAEAAMALENYRLIDELRDHAFHDALTGLANRNLLLDRVAHASAQRVRSTAAFNAVLYLDLDEFKAVNDSLGHGGGDRVLVGVAERLQSCLRDGDTAARIGGDEFAILLEDLRDEAEATHVAGRILDVLRAPFHVGNVSLTVATSMGVAVSAPGGATAEELVRNADFAMYRAKTLGKGRFELFRPELRTAATALAAMRERLHGAVERGELLLHYQPVVDLADGSIVGLEALVRWQQPQGPLLMPVSFIGAAEESGLIVPIGKWILTEACRETRRWQREHDLPTLSVSVNLSARQFQDQTLIEQVTASLQSSGLDPACLVLEITESVLMQTSGATLGRLTALRALGVRLALDDFGTGYSSLSYLEQFPVDILKIDKSFVDRIGEPRVRPVLARAILQLGRALGLDVVAEGIERPEQAAVLRRLGCVRGQGYLYARPLPPEELGPLLREGHAGTADSTGPSSRPIQIRHRRTRPRTAPSTVATPVAPAS